jgi:uncharacterized protein (DUF433 family)
MNYTDHITVNPNIMLGKPVITGTRISVEQILQKLSEGASIDEVKSMFPVKK